MVVKGFVHNNYSAKVLLDEKGVTSNRSSLVRACIKSGKEKALLELAYYVEQPVVVMDVGLEEVVSSLFRDTGVYEVSYLLEDRRNESPIIRKNFRVVGWDLVFIIFLHMLFVTLSAIILVLVVN